MGKSDRLNTQSLPTHCADNMRNMQKYGENLYLFTLKAAKLTLSQTSQRNKHTWAHTQSKFLIQGTAITTINYRCIFRSHSVIKSYWVITVIVSQSTFSSTVGVLDSCGISLWRTWDWRVAIGWPLLSASRWASTASYIRLQLPLVDKMSQDNRNIK